MANFEKVIGIFSFLIAVLSLVFWIANTIYLSQIRELAENPLANIDVSGATFFFWVNLIIAVFAGLYILYTIFAFLRHRRMERRIARAMNY